MRFSSLRGSAMIATRLLLRGRSSNMPPDPMRNFARSLDE
jgi:hypothetical protein